MRKEALVVEAERSTTPREEVRSRDSERVRATCRQRTGAGHDFNAISKKSIYLRHDI